MQTKGQSISCTVAYKIRNRKTKRVVASSLSEVHSVSEVDSSQQLWVVNQTKTGEFQIRELRTGDVLAWAEAKGALKVEKPKSRNFSWDIEKAQMENGVTYFWVKPMHSPALCLAASSLSSRLKVSAMDQTLGICLWQFIECDLKGDDFRGLSVLRSSGNLVLAVGDHSVKGGANLTQQNYTGCGSQRWIIETYHDQKEERPKEYIFRNYCSGLILTAHPAKTNGRVTQDCFNNQSSQRWKLERVTQSVFMIQSVANQSLYLGISSQKQGSAVVLTQDQKMISWTIEGCYRHL